jgi:hypothetical protein
MTGSLPVWVVDRSESEDFTLQDIICSVRGVSMLGVPYKALATALKVRDGASLDVVVCRGMTIPPAPISGSESGSESGSRACSQKEADMDECPCPVKALYWSLLWTCFFAVVGGILVLRVKEACLPMGKLIQDIDKAVLWGTLAMAVTLLSVACGLYSQVPAAKRKADIVENWCIFSRVLAFIAFGFSILESLYAWTVVSIVNSDKWVGMDECDGGGGQWAYWSKVRCSCVVLYPLTCGYHCSMISRPVRV